MRTTFCFSFWGLTILWWCLVETCHRRNLKYNVNTWLIIANLISTQEGNLFSYTVNYSSFIAYRLDISTARYFYKVSKTILHKPTANSGTNIFYNKCSYKHYLQLFIIYLILYNKQSFRKKNISLKNCTFYKILIVAVNDG